MNIHPKDPLLARLAAGLPVESRRYLAHAARCPACRERLAEILDELERPQPVLPWRQEPQPVQPPGVDRLLDGFTHNLVDLRSGFARAEDEAAGLLTELLAQPPARRALLLDYQTRFWTWPVAERLVETVRETSFHDPAGAERLAGLVLGLAGRLPEPPYRGRRGDLLARTWASLGNARRLGSDLAGAERAFAAAHACLRQGSRDALERAHLADLEASLAVDQRRFADALRLLERAAAVFGEYGELHRAGRSRVKMATVHGKAGEPERAIPLLYQALSLIDAGHEPRLDLSVRHNLMTALADAGRAMEARRLFVQSRALYRRFPEPWAENRRLWLSGKIARGLGQAAEAEAAFKSARDGFLADGIPYDTALVTLELAALYAETGRTPELRRLAAETAPIFLSRQIHREALLALSFFRQAVEREAATAETIARVIAYLRLAQEDPDLAFQTA
jgi:tetratricopeptide (TPR) repeat protein